MDDAGAFPAQSTSEQIIASDAVLLSVFAALTRIRRCSAM
jgi:hypothetical protein